ncbi:uncharacterized protein LOC111290166 [Durio zibethinus]|uniref:Uncharacterized protein LOC111290166 n=1 Tax=Durio zibethinus TaxID=66656 RepID=A0A6P5YA89_DURZI|nr:uncharacterized protein LOC111290166 [Durio zibethinus]
MDASKVHAILELELPAKVTELRLFIGMVNYYRHFIKGHSVIATPLTDLLKKGRAWEWSIECQEAFDWSKRVVTKELVLALLDHVKPYKDFLIEFDYRLEYKLGQVNTMVDALRRNVNLVAISQPEGLLVLCINEGLMHNPTAKAFIEHAKQGKTRQFWL